ncbi:hypothetical protein Ciccas_008720 [Cichlidogyrus casuarinus]|uniref:Signal sequence receptor subunit alpha n=1 Tax=Cichlidogyrus casuarinus TaxID=1844966 RepID=A0ABD2Q0H5_9PLAT
MERVPSRRKRRLALNCLSCTACKTRPPKRTRPLPAKDRRISLNQEAEDRGEASAGLPKYKHFPLLGLSGAGKTSLLSRLVPNSQNQHLKAPIQPTKPGEMNREKLRIARNRRNWKHSLKRKSKGHKMVIIDMSGNPQGRLGWLSLCTATEIGGIFYVLDASNDFSLLEASEELSSLLMRLDNCHLPIVILANKLDKARNVSVDNIMMELNLFSLDNPWKVIQTSVPTNQGLNEALISMRRMSKLYRKRRKLEKAYAAAQGSGDQISEYMRLSKDLSRRASYYSSSSSSDASTASDNEAASFEWQTPEQLRLKRILSLQTTTTSIGHKPMIPTVKADEVTVEQDPAETPRFSNNDDPSPEQMPMAHPNIETIPVWIEPSIQFKQKHDTISLPAGKIAHLAIFVSNNAPSKSNTKVDFMFTNGQLRYQPNPVYVVQNLTHIQLRDSLDSRQQGTVSYEFMPSAQLGGQSFVLLINMALKDQNNKVYFHVVVNETVNVIELEEDPHKNYLSIGFIVLVIISCSSLLFHHWMSSKGRSMIASKSSSNRAESKNEYAELVQKSHKGVKSSGNQNKNK